MSDSELITLNCWIIGEAFNNVFSVEISTSNTVSLLRTKIWKLNPEFASFSADKLVLSKIAVAGDDFDDVLSKVTSSSELPSAQILSPISKLSKIFSEEPLDGYIHIMVQCPKEPRTSQHSSVDGPSEFIQRRRGYLANFPTKALSDLAQPSEVEELQVSVGGHGFRYDRPYTAAPTMPVTLLHPVFNEFIDDCEHYQPTKADHTFALQLAHDMSGFFVNEKARQTAFIEVCQAHGISFASTEIIGTNYMTGSDMRYDGFIYSIGEAKAEMGSRGAEPVFQIGCYYTAYLKNQPDIQALDSCLPCLGLYLCGPMLGFIGLAFTDSTHIQILNHPIRLDYHYTDVRQRRMTACYLGALRKAAAKLRHYYKHEIPKLRNPHLLSNSDPRFPYYNRYTCLSDSSLHTITYTSQPMVDKLIFFGESAGTKICVKFVTRYSKEAHLYCAALGVAPKLRGFETLAGGWLMVVMDRIDEEYVSLDDKRMTDSRLLADLRFRDSILSKLEALHQAGYVHGDLRDTNVMVKENGEEGFMLLDFDWSGKIGEVRYPMNVNNGPDLWRPDDAYDEEMIKADHDIQMLQKMFDDLFRWNSLRFYH